MEKLPRTDSLIRSLESESSDVLGRLRSAATVAADLSSLGDRVVNHFVEQAREQGHSWVEIGGVLGISKQAAQQRFRVRWIDRVTGRREVRLMRYTDRAKQVVEDAAEEARKLNHNYVGTEHVLMAILRVRDGIGAKALRDLDVSVTTIRRALDDKVGRGEGPVTGNIPYTPLAKESVLYGAREEAKLLGHNYVGTEHLLLGIIRLKKCLAAEILHESGVPASEVRRAVISLLSRHSKKRTAAAR